MIAETLSFKSLPRAEEWIIALTGTDTHEKLMFSLQDKQVWRYVERISRVRFWKNSLSLLRKKGVSTFDTYSFVSGRFAIYEVLIIFLIEMTTIRVKVCDRMEILLTSNKSPSNLILFIFYWNFSACERCQTSLVQMTVRIRFWFWLCACTGVLEELRTVPPHHLYTHPLISAWASWTLGTGI